MHHYEHSLISETVRLFGSVDQLCVYVENSDCKSYFVSLAAMRFRCFLKEDPLSILKYRVPCHASLK